MVKISETIYLVIQSLVINFFKKLEKLAASRGY